jgi:hypothetical protein
VVVKNWVGDHIVHIDEDVQTFDNLVGEVTAGEISSSAKNIGSHLYVLGLEYLEKAQPENLRVDTENTGPSFEADQGRAGLFSGTLGQNRVTIMSLLYLISMFMSLSGLTNVTLFLL